MSKPPDDEPDLGTITSAIGPESAQDEIDALVGHPPPTDDADTPDQDQPPEEPTE